MNWSAFLIFILVSASSSDEDEEIDKSKVISIILLTIFFTFILASLLLCIARLSREVILQLNYRRGLHRQLKALQSYKECSYLMEN